MYQCVCVFFCACVHHNKKGERRGEAFVKSSFLPLAHFCTSCALLLSYAISTGWRSVMVAIEDNEDGIFVFRGRSWQVRHGGGGVVGCRGPINS